MAVLRDEVDKLDDVIGREDLKQLPVVFDNRSDAVGGVNIILGQGPAGESQRVLRWGALFHLD